MSQTPPLWVFRDEPLDGPTNMARDEHLLYSEAVRPAALRIYAWRPATISLGYFQRFERLAELPDELRALPVVRRQTGGGAILHDREVTYCLVVDDTVALARQSPPALYAAAHECWREALRESGTESELAPDHLPLPTPRTGPFFCFEKPGRTDLVVGDRKLLGSAQRRIPGRVLQHGSLLTANPFAAHPGADLRERDAARIRGWIDRFILHLGERLTLEPRDSAWNAEALADVQSRRQKFASDEWTCRL